MTEQVLMNRLLVSEHKQMDPDGNSGQVPDKRKEYI